MNTTAPEKKKSKKSPAAFFEGLARLAHRIFDEKAPKQKKSKEKKLRSEFTSFLLSLGIFAPLCALLLPLFILFFTDDHVVTNLFELIAGYANIFAKELGGLCPALVSLGAWALLLGLIRLIFKKKVQRYCITKATVLSVTAGLCASAGVYGAVNAVISFITQSSHNRHPLGIRVGILLALAALAGLIVCLALYISTRIKRFTWAGLAFDLLTVLLTAFSLFSLGGVAEHLLSVAVHLMGW
ncbi:MAG: hypothetical protein J6M12_04010 [Clostridia bacterium]|nr:hypothetical protein [Clostridia bacterium]